MSKNKKNKNYYDVEDIEVVVGDNTNLNISSVGVCMNNLRPKDKKNKKVIIPTSKKQKNK